MVKKSKKKKIDLNKQATLYLKDNPEIAKTLKVFNMSLNEYKQAVNSISNNQPIINFKNTQWLPGNR